MSDGTGEFPETLEELVLSENKDSEVKRCVWYHSHTLRDGTRTKPPYCNNCEGYDQTCEYYEFA